MASQQSFDYFTPSPQCNQIMQTNQSLFWPQGDISNTLPTQPYMLNPTLPMNNAMNNSINYNNMQSNYPRWKPFDINSRPRMTYWNRHTPNNNYPRQFSQSQGYYGNLSQYSLRPQPGTSTQNVQQFNLRPRFTPRQNLINNRPNNSIKHQPNETNTETSSEVPKRKLKFKLPLFLKKWNREDAEKACAAENKYIRPKDNMSIKIKFPDHLVSKKVVENFHRDITTVHFHVPCTKRYCFIKLQPNANVENVVKILSETTFQHEKLQVEVVDNQCPQMINPEHIDPYTLYLGNIPEKMTSDLIKKEFPKAIQIDCGMINLKHCLSYAFIQFPNVEDAIQSLKEKNKLTFNDRSLVLKFRRNKKKINLQEEEDTKEHNEDNIPAVDTVSIEPSDKSELNAVNESKSKTNKDINELRCPDIGDDYDSSYEEIDSYDLHSKEMVPSCIQNDIPLVLKDDDDDDIRWYEKSDDEDEIDPIYTFILKNKILFVNNNGITCQSTTDREMQVK